MRHAALDLAQPADRAAEPAAQSRPASGRAPCAARGCRAPAVLRRSRLGSCRDAACGLMKILGRISYCMRSMKISSIFHGEVSDRWTGSSRMTKSARPPVQELLAVSTICCQGGTTARSHAIGRRNRRIAEMPQRGRAAECWHRTTKRRDWTRRRSSTRRSCRAARCAPSCPTRSTRRRSATSWNVAARAPSGTNMQPWRVYVDHGRDQAAHRRRHPQLRHPRRKGGVGRVQILSRPVLRAVSIAPPQGRLRPLRPARHRPAATSTACARSTTATSCSSTRRSA